MRGVFDEACVHIYSDCIEIFTEEINNILIIFPTLKHSLLPHKHKTPCDRLNMSCCENCSNTASFIQAWFRIKQGWCSSLNSHTFQVYFYPVRCSFECKSRINMRMSFPKLCSVYVVEK